jgi:predicted RNA binding protein YcfA (HicA-like mRNA interferase family)
MRIPRDLSAQELIKILKKHGYIVSRQTGSHIRITTQINGEHHVTIPNHDPIKLGILNAILNEISNHLSILKENIL